MVARPDYRGFEWYYLWNRCNGHATKLDGHRGGAWSIDFSPDGKTLATGDAAGSVKLWDFATGQMRGQLRVGVGVVMSLRFSPDGQTLATAVVTEPSARLPAYPGLLLVATHPEVDAKAIDKRGPPKAYEDVVLDPPIEEEERSEQDPHDEDDFTLCVRHAASRGSATDDRAQCNRPPGQDHQPRD